MKLEFFIAFRYLRSPKKSRSISFITNIAIAGVTIGVMALIVVLSVMNGFEQDLKKALIGANAHLVLSAFSDNGEKKIEKSSQFLTNLRQTIEAEHIAPYSLNQALISSNGISSGILVRGVDLEIEMEGSKIDSLLKKNLYEDKENQNRPTAQERAKEMNEILSALKDQTRKFQNGKTEKLAGIVVGTALAKKLDLDLDASLTIFLARGRISPFGQIPLQRKFVVVGFYESGLSAYDEVFTLIDLEEAQKTFQLGNSIRGYSIFLDNLNRVKKTQEKLEQKYPFPYTVTSWIDNNYNLFAVLKLEKIGLGLILFLIILVAAFNIISSLVILVSEKRKDVAILKTMGMPNASIRNIFMLQGFIIGLFGSLLGTSLGLLLCWFLKSFSVIKIPQGVYVSDRIPMLVDWFQVGLILFVSLLACFLVTLFPSQKASRQKPIDGLRYE